MPREISYFVAAKKKKKKKPKKKKATTATQSEPPRVGLSKLFPNGVYPEGEIQEYKDEYVYHLLYQYISCLLQHAIPIYHNLATPIAQHPKKSVISSAKS